MVDSLGNTGQGLINPDYGDNTFAQQIDIPNTDSFGNETQSFESQTPGGPFANNGMIKLYGLVKKLN